MAKKAYRVLHIEDDPASRLVIKKILQNSPFEYYEAGSGMEGLKKVEKIAPDLILMDINLPDISGVELTTKIKSDPAFKKIVVVALTGIRDPEARALSLIAGCDGYIPKPVDVKNFEKQLLQFLQGKRDVLEIEKRDYFHQKYEETLVSRLTEKLSQLEATNLRLSQTTNILKEYSQKLEISLSIINVLQQCNSPRELERCLVDEVVDKFGFQRCFFLAVNYEESLLQIDYARGLPREEWDKYALPYNINFFYELFEEKQIIYVPDPQKISDQQIRKILSRLSATEFILGLLGVPHQKRASDRQSELTNQFVESLVPSLYDQKDTDVEIIQEHLREFLASEIFYLGGYLYLDYVSRDRIITSYDVHILEMLLKNASLIYQNLQLSEQLKELFIRAEKDAITDYLTNLYNYRYFTQQLSREFNRAQRHNLSFVLLMIDIDFFKTYNDTFGHQAGDLVLKKLARILQENTRNSDIVSRYGGEEFVIICPELTKRKGHQLAEKIRRIISETHFPQEEKLPYHKVTVSIGVAAYPDDGQSPKDLVKKADLALYHAKRLGRNRVCEYSPDISSET